MAYRFASAASKRVARQMRAPNAVQRRMAHAEPQYEGLEATVRTYLPRDAHIVTAVLGLYGGLVALVANSGATPTNPKATFPDYHTEKKATSDIPSMEENPEEWEQFIAADDNNFEKYMLHLAESEEK